MSAKRPESKYWCFTSYLSECPWNEDNCTYVIYGREVCPDTKRKHLQGFVAFAKKTRLSAIKKIDAEGHYEIKRATIKEAVEYCKKDGDYTEIGEMPDDNSGAAIRKCIECAKKGDLATIEDLSPGLYLRYKRTFEGMRVFDLPELTQPTGYWVYGQPGTSKDSNVLKLKPFVKSHNKWWDGYDGQPYVLISDVDHSTAKWIGHFLKIWMDMHPFNAEVKGGVVTIRPQRVYVTSNYMITELFSEDENLCNALKRRCHVICFDSDTVYPRPVIDHTDKIKLIDF